MANRESHKTPIVTLFNQGNQEIASSLSRVGLSVVDFRYKFDDEDDDICTIKLQADNFKPLDSLGISYNSILLVQWGYLEGAVSNKATIVVRDIKTKYGPNVIWVSLECTDFVTYLKTQRGNDSQELSILQYVQSKCQTSRGYNYKVVIKQFGKVVYKQDKVKTRDSQEVSVYNTDIIDHPNFDPFIDGWKLVTRIVPNTPSNGKFLEGGSTELIDFLTKERPFTDANRSPYQVLRDVFKYAPDGPWYICGRGDTILIHNRDLSGRPIRTYNYAQEPGDLIDLSIISKYEAFEERVVSSPYMNPEDKISYYEDIYLKELSNLNDIGKILKGDKITKAEKKELLKTFIATYRASKYHAVELIKLDIQRRGGYSKGNLFTGEIGGKTGNYIDFADRDSLGDAKIKDYGPEGFIWDPDKIDEVSPAITAFLYMLPALTANETRDMVDNVAREAEMDKVEANFIIEGDPILKSEVTIRLGNIQRIHSGDYYIKKLEHIISRMGYKVQGEALKVMPKAAIVGTSISARQVMTDESGNVTSDTGQEVIDRYKREQALFTNWGIEILVNSREQRGNSFPGLGPAEASTHTVKDYQPLSDFIVDRESVQLDELVEDILKREIKTVPKPNTESR